MRVMTTIAEKIRQDVKQKFYDVGKEWAEPPLNISQDDPFWFALDKRDQQFKIEKREQRRLFDSLIAQDITGLNPAYIYKLQYKEKEKGKESVEFGDLYLEVSLRFLGYQGVDFKEMFYQFCEERCNSQEIKAQKELPQSRVRSAATVQKIQNDKDNLKEINELRKRLGRLMYASTQLTKKKWWFYFHGYTKYKILPEKNTWTLVKLLLVFEDIDENGELVVRIDNTSIEHYDYIGTVDFQSSRSEIMVMNFETVPYIDRQLNIKVHVGTGEGDLFLGQYLNYEGDGHIISGNFIMERIAENEELNIEPAVYQIDNLPNDQTEYTEDYEGISQYIIQYLHDKNKNFRRTPLRAGHSLHGLKSWLETRKAEDNPECK